MGWAAHGLCGVGEVICWAGIVSRCLPGTGGSCVWARAQQVWGSQRLVQDVHAVPHRPPSWPCVRPCAAAFYLSGSVLLGVQCFLLITELPHKHACVMQGEEAGMGVSLKAQGPRWYTVSMKACMERRDVWKVWSQSRGQEGRPESCLLSRCWDWPCSCCVTSSSLMPSLCFVSSNQGKCPNP